MVQLVGYVPEKIAASPGFKNVVRTSKTGDFSVPEPVQMWTDLLLNGVSPANVTLLCLGGGDISAQELALEDWDALTEDLRESNRQQADHIWIKVRALNCEVVSGTDPRQPVSAFTPEQVEMLAEMEHRRWVAERRMAGWSYAPQKNIPRRENPNLTDWDKLSDSVKEYDRIAVRAIPTLLAGAGKKICPNGKGGGV